MRQVSKNGKVSPATGTAKSSTSTPGKGEHMYRVERSSTDIRAKLLRSMCMVAVMLTAFAFGKNVEFDRGLDGTTVRGATQVMHIELNAAGISCSVDSAYGPDFLWTPWFDSAILTIDATGASSLVLFDKAGGDKTDCASDASVRVTGAVDIEFSQTTDGAQYLLSTSGRSMGYVHVSVREMISRIVSATEVVTTR
jgi:hypothetical protein